MANIKFEGEIAQNYEQKCLCVLLLDTSGSMNEIVDNSNAVQTGKTALIDGVSYNVVEGGISRIDKLNEGIASFYSDIQDDPTSTERLEIAVITFNDKAQVVQQPSLIDDCPPPMLQAQGMTNLQDAIETAMDMVEARKSWYKSTNQPYYRPWVILITDGEPNSNQNVDAIAQIIEEEVKMKHFQFLPIGVDNANMDVLNKLSVELPALPLQGTKFTNFFKWLSASMGTIITSNPGEKVDITQGATDWITQLSSYEV